jgi:hypothetical protein
MHGHNRGTRALTVRTCGMVLGAHRNGSRSGKWSPATTEPHGSSLVAPSLLREPCPPADSSPPPPVPRAERWVRSHQPNPPMCARLGTVRSGHHSPAAPGGLPVRESDLLICNVGGGGVTRKLFFSLQLTTLSTHRMWGLACAREAAVYRISNLVMASRSLRW